MNKVIVIEIIVSLNSSHSKQVLIRTVWTVFQGQMRKFLRGEQERRLANYHLILLLVRVKQYDRLDTKLNLYLVAEMAMMKERA